MPQHSKKHDIKFHESQIFTKYKKIEAQLFFNRTINVYIIMENKIYWIHLVIRSQLLKFYLL